MKLLNEINILTNIHLSNTQKFVLTKLVAAPTPHLAYDWVSEGVNVVATREQLTKLGLMTYKDGEAYITPEGLEALREENLVDEMDELTDEGKRYAYADSPEEAEKQKIDKEPELPEPEKEKSLPFESWKMIYEMTINKEK